MVRSEKRNPFWLIPLGILLAGILLTGLILCLDQQTEGEDTSVLNTPKGCFRILVAARDRTSGLCDVMMLVCLDRDRDTLSVLQIPRDTYASFGNDSYRKINGAPLCEGGMAVFRDALSEALCLPIDRYVLLSADAFRKGVEALGGVEITLSEPMDYEDPAQGLSIHLKAGRSTLNGKEAEWFVRYRADYVRGDLGRLDAQKIFLAAFAKKAMETRSPLRLVRLASSLMSEVQTDLGFSDLTVLAEEAMSLSAEALSLVSAPGEEARGKSGGSYYVLSRPGLDELLRSHFGKETEGVDPKGRFLYTANAEFRRIYESKADYRVYTASEIGKEGILIPRT